MPGQSRAHGMLSPGLAPAQPNGQASRAHGIDAALAKVDLSKCPTKPAVFKDGPVTALASYPGSGSTLSRLLIEQATGVLTGSVYKDTTLLNGRPYPYKGEFTEERVWVCRSTPPSRMDHDETNDPWAT